MLDAQGTRHTYDALGNLVQKLTAAGQQWSNVVLLMQFVKSALDAHYLIPQAVWTDNQVFFDKIGLNHVARKINPKDAIENNIMLAVTEALGGQYNFNMKII